MLYHMQEEMRKISDNTSSRYSDFSRNRNSIGELKNGDDIFVFLHKFEAIMHSKCIPQEFWLEHVSPSLRERFVRPILIVSKILPLMLICMFFCWTQGGILLLNI